VNNLLEELQLRLSQFYLFDVLVSFGPLDYFITVFWFVLFINAVNLIDGLDGLASGIVVFASIVMVILSVIRKDFLTALLFAALGGSVLGFLRYNFNPASIFLGDGGSYFLGYTIAGLSIMGSVKSQVGAAMLIPLLALGVPIFDTLMTPLRRFVRGRKMFSPDNGHVHHRLLGKGLTTRRVVLIIYLTTACLCVIAVALVNIRDEQAGLFMIILGICVVIFVQKLGYFEYIATDKIYGWFKDLTYEAGLSRERRSFLSIQIEIENSRDIDELWQNVDYALEMLKFDYAAFYLNSRQMVQEINRPEEGACSLYHLERRKTHAAESSACLRKESPDWSWESSRLANNEKKFTHSLLKLELPLSSSDNRDLGTLVLIKDVKKDSLEHYALRRGEHLRRSISSALGRIKN